MAEMTDEEVFGSSTSMKPKEFSDAEVFGGTQTKAMSDADVGLGESPGVSGYLGEAAKRFTRDLVETSVSSPLRGLAAKLPTDTAFEEALGRVQQGEDPASATEAVRANPPPLRKTTEEPAWKVAEAVSSTTSNLLPDRNLLNPVVGDIVGGFGSVAGNILTGITPGIRAAAIPSLLSQGAGEAAERAVRTGATEEQIRRAARLGDISGASEFLDLLLLNTGSIGRAGGLIRRVGVSALTGAMIEGGQEGLQQFIQNKIAQGVYNPKQDVMEGVAYNALIGAIVGGGVGSVMPKERTAPNVAPAADTLQAVGAELTSGFEIPDIPRTGPEANTIITMPGGGGVRPLTSVPFPNNQNRPAPVTPVPPSPVPQAEPPAAPATQPEMPQEPEQPLSSLPPEEGMVTSPAALRTGGVPASAPTETPVVQPGATTPVAPAPGLDYNSLWNMVWQGRTSVNGQPITLLQAASVLRQRGVLNSQEDFTTFADQFMELTRASANSPDYREQVMGLVDRWGKGYSAGENPTEANETPNVMPSSIVDLVRATGPKPETEPVSLPTSLRDVLQPSDTTLEPLKEEIEAQPGSDVGRLIRIVGPSLYGDPTKSVTIAVKELFQNAADAISPLIQKGEMEVGHIDVTLDKATRTITFKDDGTGMEPSVLANEFFKIAGSKKEGSDAGGGFGVAKAVFVYANKGIKVITMRNGKVAEVNSDGTTLSLAADGKAPKPKIQIRTPTAQDRATFPEGHGTLVQVQMYDSFINPNNGEKTDIEFNDHMSGHPVLMRSPLFRNIEVRVNSIPTRVGANFPLENWTQFVNVTFPWGNARIYVTKEQNNSAKYGSNVGVLSNGIWQFNSAIKLDPSKTYGENVPYEFYVDLNPKVKPDEPGYPIAIQRMDFAPSLKQPMQQLFTQASLIFSQQNFQTSVENFGTIQYLDLDMEKGKVNAGETQRLEPKVPPRETPLTLIKPGDTVNVVDGKLYVQNRPVPEMSFDELRAFQIDFDALTIDQSTIDPNRIILHDNTDVEVSAVEKQAIVDYGREKFGERFDEFVFAMGAAFREIRDATMRYMGGAQSPLPQEDSLRVLDALGQEIEDMLKGAPPPLPTPSMFDQQPFSVYDDLGRVGIGVSLDKSYRGANIVIPFKGMFINPFLVLFSARPDRAALGAVSTMIHEVAHHSQRNHGPGFRDEMVKIQVVLNSTETFNMNDFIQKVTNIYGMYWDVFKHINGVYTDGSFTIRARGKRFEDDSIDERSDGGVSRDATGPSGDGGSIQGGRGARLSEWVEASKAVPPTREGRTEPAAEVKPSRAQRPSDGGRRRNYAALKVVDPGISAPPQQPDINFVRSTVGSALGGGKGSGGGSSTLPPTLKEAAAHADRMNWFYKWFAGVIELLDANPMFHPLRKYVERVRLMHNDETKVHDASLKIIKDWRHLGEQSKNLESFLIELQDMTYLTPTERRAEAWRHPTPTELRTLITKHKMSDAAVRVYEKIRNHNDIFITLIGQNAKEHAERTIQDLVKRADRMVEINEKIKRSKSMPFFPFTRFGRYYLEAKNAAGTTVHFETFEPKRLVGLTVKRAEKYQNARKRELEAKLGTGFTVETGVLPESAGPFTGMHPLLLQMIADPAAHYGLSPAQIKAIEKLQHMRNPAMSLKDRSLYNPRQTEGYSLDLRRSFARYYFHGGRYYAKTKHSWALRAHIAEAQLVPGNKSGLISDYMDDHLTHTVLDARGDFGFFKGAIFTWAMGYVPAAATQNLSQIPMVTLPFLSAKFGEHRAGRHILKAIRQRANFYRKGAYKEMLGTPGANFEIEAMAYGVETGRISETQAPEIAGFAGGGNLVSGQGGSAVERAAVMFQEKAAWFFEMAEQANRRTTFMATLRLAKENPAAKYVEESAKKYKDEYELLKAKFGEADARALITAINAVDQTQFVYARYARPRFMRGPVKSTVFVFQRYMQSMLFMLGHNWRDVGWRYLFVAMLVGGLGGVPGYEDFQSILKAVGRRLFGSDFNPDKEVRNYVMQWFDGRVDPDLVLHGLARKGFGLPAMVDMMGSMVTNGSAGRGLLKSYQEIDGLPEWKKAQTVPYPVLDRSRAVTLSKILPVDVGKMLEPGEKVDKTLADQTQRASGAVFSVGFNVYKALFDREMEVSDPKRWERAVPRALASVSKAFRTFDAVPWQDAGADGRERGRGLPNSASTIVRYDRRDTEHMMEIIATGMGYQPLRTQHKWDNILAQAELNAFYKMRRESLLEQMFEARFGGNANEIEKVRQAIVKYNTELPDYARGKAITSTTVDRSMQMRGQVKASREVGIPRKKSDIPIAREINRLYPATIDVRKVD